MSKGFFAFGVSPKQHGLNIYQQKGEGLRADHKQKLKRCELAELGSWGNQVAGCCESTEEE